jgi:type IV pilus biogenesis protein PilP
MNRNHFQKRTPLRSKALAALLLAACAFTPAMAQQADDGLVIPAANGQGHDPVVQGQGQRPGPLQAIKLPDGATVGDADTKIKEMSNDAAKALNELVGSSVGDRREQSAIDARSQDKREIEALKTQVDKATLAKQLYVIVHGDEDKTKAELQQVKNERDDLSSQVKSLEDQLANAQKQIASQAVKSKDPNPVIVSIVGSGGSLSAKLLVPFYGETIVHRGDLLANGQTVTSISADGVSVSRDGETSRLAFGTSVPAQRR